MKFYIYQFMDIILYIYYLFIFVKKYPVKLALYVNESILK